VLALRAYWRNREPDRVSASSRSRFCPEETDLPSGYTSADPPAFLRLPVRSAVPSRVRPCFGGETSPATTGKPRNPERAPLTKPPRAIELDEDSYPLISLSRSLDAPLHQTGVDFCVRFSTVNNCSYAICNSAVTDCNSQNGICIPL